MAFLSDWRLALPTLGWLVVALVTAVALAVAGHRSRAPERHAIAWAWLVFVSSSQAIAWWGMHGNARCSMSYSRVWLIMLVGAVLGSVCAVSTFWWVRARRWGGPRTTLLAALASTLLATLFVGSVVWFWASDSCSPGPWSFEIAFIPDLTSSNMSWGLFSVGVATSVGLGIAGHRSTAPSRHALAWAWLAFVATGEIYAWHEVSQCDVTDVPSVVLIGGGLGAACALAAFRLVRARRWGGPRSTTVASLLSALLLVGFVYLSYSMQMLCAGIYAPDGDIP
jgi:hypothetical protein